MRNIVKIGCVHGRFQPLHLGHLEYIVEALRRCEYLWIGLTQFDIKSFREVEAAKHRSFPTSNPLTYWERVLCIKSALEECNVNPGRFGFTPFPIECPEKVGDFMGKDVICFTTIYDEWNRSKVYALREFGFNVDVLWERDRKEFTGTEVRNSMETGSDEWRLAVPRSVAVKMDEWKIPDRLRALRKLAE